MDLCNGLELNFGFVKTFFGNEKGIQTFSAPSMLARLILTPNFLHLLLRILSNRKILDHNITVWLWLTIQEILSVLLWPQGWWRVDCLRWWRVDSLPYFHFPSYLYEQNDTGLGPDVYTKHHSHFHWNSKKKNESRTGASRLGWVQV